MSRWVDLDACPCNECLIKVDCIARYDGECSKYKDWKKGADVAPVKHGHWEDTLIGTMGKKIKLYVKVCSVCGHEAMERGSNYCPKCGSKMDEQDAKSE